MNELPQDPFMLMSFVNTKLRDQYASLNEFCDAMDVQRDEICAKLAAIGMEYNSETNKFW